MTDIEYRDAINQERLSKNRLNKMVDEYEASLRTLWHWGDGDGDWILEIMRDRLRK